MSDTAPPSQAQKVQLEQVSPDRAQPSISTVRDYTAPLGNLFPRLILLTVKTCFLVVTWNLMCVLICVRRLLSPHWAPLRGVWLPVLHSLLSSIDPH